MREKGRSNEFKKIVVPIDTSFESRQKVPVAIRLAKQFDSTLHLLGVSVGNDKEAEHKVNAYIRQSKHTIEEAGIKYVMEKRLGGNVTDLTIDYAKSIDADLILCMTEQEPQLGSFFLGKFAQQMVNHSTVPVMSLMPREDLMLGEAVL
jgi:nucleotide-binding universal stress UspA family protein